MFDPEHQTELPHRTQQNEFMNKQLSLIENCLSNIHDDVQSCKNNSFSSGNDSTYSVNSRR